MNKLIKLSDQHFIVVDDSPIKEGDWCYDKQLKIFQASHNYNGYNTDLCKKITHSTQPLDGIEIYKDFDDWFENQSQEQLEEFEKEFGYYGHDIGTSLKEWKGIYKEKNPVKHISLSEVEEAIYGYSVDKMANLHRVNISEDWSSASYIKGFKAHQELVKDKLFTVEDMQKAWNTAFIDAMSLDEETYKPLFFEDFIQTLLPKTEWEIQFDEQDKIRLL